MGREPTDSREGSSPLGLGLVELLLLTMQSVLGARRTGAAHSVVEQAESAMQSAFGPVWETIDRLDLEVGSDTIRFGQADVLTRLEDGEGLIDALGRAGIVALVIHPGAELEDIKLVLAAVVATTTDPEARGSDLLTYLFRADLHHIEYEVERDEWEGVFAGAAPSRIERSGSLPREPPEILRDTLRRDASTRPDSGLVQLEKFDSTLYFLDEREIKYLKSAIDAEYSRDLPLNTLALLLDILEMRAEPAIREEVIGIIEDFLPELLMEGRFEAVAALVSGIREAARAAVDLTATQKEALNRIRSSISTPKALSQLFHALEGGAVAPTAHSMDVLLRELRPAGVRELLTWGDRLTDSGTRAAVVEALDAFFTKWPHGLARMLNAPDLEVVHSGLDLAGRLKEPEFVDIVGEVAAHQDPKIRRHVAETFAAIATAAALRRLLGMAEDPDQGVRIVVYSTFAARPSRGALSTLKRAITGTDLEPRGQREKRLLFEAFGAVAGPEGVNLLEPLLRGRTPFGRRPSSHTRACAASALGIIGSPSARAVLQASVKDKDPLVRNAVGTALRGAS